MYKIPRCRFYLVQNPPTLPILPLLILICFLKNSRLIIDYHNYGFTLMRVNGRPSFLIKIARYL